MNDQQYIESLLDLFMQGSTTLEQERELSNYFAHAQSIPPEWEPYKEMMAYFDDGMPVITEPVKRRHLAPVWWTAIAAAAVATIIIAVAPQLSRDPIQRVAPQASVITADTDETVPSDTVAPATVSPRGPIIAKVEKETSSIVPQGIKLSHKPRKRSSNNEARKTKLNVADVERAQGDIEQAQQELMADILIIEQEQQEVIREQYASRAQVYQAQQAVANEAPQFIQVVFK